MMTKWAGLTVAISVLVLSGCASMSGDECVMSDWHAIGFEDGSRGYTADRLGNHRKACAKHGVAPNFDAYQAGRAEGLHQFCQPSRGFNLGASGGRYNGVCPSASEPAFLDAYNSGYQLHNLRSNVNSATAKINIKKRELERVEEEIKHAEVALISQDTTTEDRVLLLADLKDLSERTGQLEAEIYTLVEDRAILEQQLASYERVLADSGY
jgi:hypothetical protein